jgi:signal transduction histidine kinase/CheY-like chemotaxis protein/ligand-binding sensor domain-containing protein
LISRSVYTRLCILVAPFAISLQLLSAAGPPPEIGMPLVRNYYSRDYKGGGQTWTIFQDRRGVMLLGEGGGEVLTYDGAVWRKVFVPTSVIRSLNMDETGRVWVGTVGLFGYLEVDASGSLRFVSMLDKIAPEDRGFTDLWQILPTAQGVYFRAYERLFRWDGQHMHVWRAKSRFEALSLVRGRTYTAQGGIGLQEIVGDELRDLPGGAAYKNGRKLFLHPWDDGRILVSQRDGLLTLYDGQKAVPFPTQADKFLVKQRVYTSTLLPDGGICLTTLLGGALIVNHDGSLRLLLDKGAGLIGGTTYSAFVDREGALWVGQDTGVSRVEVNSPVSVLTYDSTSDVARFNGSLYVTTAAGPTPIAKAVADQRTGAWALQGLKTDVSQAWTMLHFRDPSGRGQDQLLTIAAAGLMRIEGDRVFQAMPDVHGDHESGDFLIQSRKTPARVFIAHMDGLSSVRWDGRKWINEGRLPNTVYRFSTLAEDDDGVLWAGGGASEGLVVRVDVAPDGMAASKGRIFSSKDGLIGGDISVEFAGGGLYAMPNNAKQAYRWDRAAGRFVVDNRFLLPMDGPDLSYGMWATSTDEVWSATLSAYEQRLAVFRRQADGRWLGEEEPYRALSGFRVSLIRTEPDLMWDCSNEGLLRYDRKVKPAGLRAFSTLVSQVTAGAQTVFGGVPVAGAAAPRLAHDHNSVRFEFGAPAYGKESETLYQYRLEGADQDWTAWAKQTEANYSNLGPGSYRFRVHSRTVDGRIGSEAGYAFVILPPWYRTWWAWTLYALLLAAAGYGLEQLLRRRLIQRERERSRIREAELRAETAAARAQVLQSENERKKNVELLSDIGREITASLDLETILFKLYERVNDILDATIFGVGLYRPQEQVIEYTLAIENGKRYAPYTRDMRDKNQFAVWCIEHRQPLMMNDVEAEASKYVPSYRHDSDLLLEDGSIAQPPASMMYLPLVAQDRVLGVLSVQSYKKNAYTEQHLSLLENLAAYTTIALDNAGAYRMVAERENEIRSQAAELATINRITQALSTQLDMDRLIPLVGDQVRDLFHAPIVYLALLDRSTMTINFPYTFGEDSQSMPFGQGLTSQIIRTGQPLLINEDLNGSTSRMGVQHLGRHASAYLGVPIPSGGEMIGVISVQSTGEGRRFSEADQRLLATVASAVGVAIHNAKLFEDARQARAAAEDADAAKSSFLSTVSHELRTPLTSVLGFAKIIRRRLEERLFPLIPEDDRKVQQAKQQVISNLGVVVSEGERLTKLIDDVLDLAKIEAGKFSWNMAKISVSEVLERAIGATSSLFEAKKLDLVRRIEPELPDITGDRDRLIQVVINLISNAVKFTDSGAIECSACVRGAELVVSVTDNGIGIAPADQGKVFEKFKQVGDTLTDKPKGTGLGLPICKEIVEYHGGRIWVESEPGKGSTFSFAIPLPDGAGPVPRTIDIESLVRQLREKVASHEPRANSILVVDDDANIRSLLQQEFTENGYSVRLAENGRRALELVREETPGLIVLDVMMPEMNGFDVAAVLKNDPATMDIPIIILSIVEDQERGLRLGVDRYLTKPIDTATLFREVGALLEQGKSKKKVMVVDEDASTVRTLVNVLEARGYQVVESNGEELVADAVLAKPDIIILNSLLSSNRGVRSLRFEKGLENVLFLIYQ